MSDTPAVKHIHEHSKDPVINIALDTLAMRKQALVFVSSRASAEKCAEDISRSIKEKPCEALSEKVLHVLAKPTKQCERLAKCVLKGIAFHHAGLAPEQKDLIEDHFRSGDIKIICCTPTLAYGVDMPAFRAIIRDLYRFSDFGMQHIPVLDFHQMIGRAGRPGKEEFGEAICIAKTDREAELIVEKFFKGEPETIYSKLAVEPVFRTYLLSLIAADFVSSRKEILAFFSRTFYAHQYKDLERLAFIVDKMLALLEEWEFIQSDGDAFKPADALDTTYRATLMGKRVAQLYLDPYTAHMIVEALKRVPSTPIEPFSFLHLISSCLEIRPYVKAKAKELEDLQDKLFEKKECLLTEEPSLYDIGYEDFLDQFKTALFFDAWVNEKDEEFLLETYNIRPGEIKVKIDRADWLLYSSEELARILQMHPLMKEFGKLRVRIKQGAKEELLPLLQLREIGRVRARKLFDNRMQTIEDLKNTDLGTLKQLIGEKTALHVKEQLGQAVESVPKGTRKGQLSMEKFDKGKKKNKFDS